MTTAHRRRLFAVGAAVAWFVGPSTYLLLEALAATGFNTPYSYLRDYISDLGVPSQCALAYVMNIAFCVQGALFFVGAGLVVGAFQSGRTGLFLSLAGANTVGNVMVAAVHSGPTAHADGSIRVHEAGALLAIVGGNAAVLVISSVIGGVGPLWYRRVTVGLGTLGLVAFLLLIVGMQVAGLRIVPPAVWERVSVYTITAGQYVTAAHLVTRRR